MRKRKLYQKMKNKEFFLWVLVTFSIMSFWGCATTGYKPKVVNGVDVTKGKLVLLLEGEGIPFTPCDAIDRWFEIIEIDNDLYFRESIIPGLPSVWWDTYQVKSFWRLTNTPNTKEIGVHYDNKSGYISYFALDGDGGQWYTQPLLGDDSNRKEISAEDLNKLK